MTAPLVLAALLCTHPTHVPVSNDCGAALTAQAERPAYRWLVRRRSAFSSAWYDTIRWTPHPGDRPGQVVRLPLAVPAGTWVFEVAAVDSAGNVACWSNPVVRFR